MKHITPFALVFGLCLASLSAHVSAGNAQASMAQSNSADITVEADRLYSFIEPKTGRVTALAVANDRPSMTMSIDKTTQTVYLTTANDDIASVSIADLADAYAQGDAERRAAFLVSMQRTPSTASRESTAACDMPLCSGENEPTAQLASIVRWAVENVGRHQRVTSIEAAPIQAATAEEGDAEDRGRSDLVDFDPWQTATAAPNFLHSLHHFWRPWR
jgi:hypothetical protein